jgi:hypothetical protein
MKCGDCKHGIGQPGMYGGECHRYPPQIAMDDEDKSTEWPEVGADDVCGEWAPRLCLFFPDRPRACVDCCWVDGAEWVDGKAMHTTTPLHWPTCHHGRLHRDYDWQDAAWVAAHEAWHDLCCRVGRP